MSRTTSGSGRISSEHLCQGRMTVERIRLIQNSVTSTSRFSSDSSTRSGLRRPCGLDLRGPKLCGLANGSSYRSLVHPLSEGHYCFSLLSDGTTWYFQHVEFNFHPARHCARAPCDGFSGRVGGAKSLGAGRRSTGPFFSSTSIFRWRGIVEGSGSEHAEGRRGLLCWSQNVGSLFSPAQSICSLSLLGNSEPPGNDVTLVRLDENEAVVRLNMQCLALYQNAGTSETRNLVRGLQTDFGDDLAGSCHACRLGGFGSSTRRGLK